MANPPYKVKAVFDYASGHDDDLNFPTGQIITVTEEEGDDWYVGEYVDGSGSKKEGMFPRNFVEKYEPQAPPRPTRTRTAVKESVASATAPVEAQARSPAEETPKSTTPTASSVPPPAEPSKPPESTTTLNRKPSADKPAPAGSKGPPPPVAKPSSNAFKDRIAAFNKPSAAPIAPGKPGGPSTGFIKKPFVAPPPSRNAYVPVQKQEAPQKLYRREEDPEILERQQKDQEDAERAGLSADAERVAEEGDSSKTTSLKDRIALLQKQQQEAAARRAEASQREKPARPPKARQESSSQANATSEDGGASLRRSPSGDSLNRGSVEIPRESGKPAVSRKISREPRSSGDMARDVVSDGNEADQSGAGETTEDANDDLTEVEDFAAKPEPQLAPHPPTEEEARRGVDSDEEDEEHEEEEEQEEETEEQAEARRKEELRARMAKMSGGMGMAGMFGPPGAHAMPAPAPRKKAAAQDSAASPPAQRVPMVPVPGMGGAPPVPSRSEVAKEMEPPAPLFSDRPADQLPDVEDVEPASTRDRAPPPVPTHARPSAAPPVPSHRTVPPLPDSRTAPPPPAQTNAPATTGSESDEEEPAARRQRTSTVIAASEEKQLPSRGPPPPVPAGAPAPPTRPEGPRSPSSTAAKRISAVPMSPPPIPSSPPPSGEKRLSKVPTVPLGSPQMLPPGEIRAPPPPPPTAAPPSRQSTISRPPNDSDEEHESEYEGDYDTDIASGAPHKDALKAHSRDSVDESTFSEDASVPPSLQPRAAPSAPPPTQRSAPPPPPPNAPRLSRQSTETPRPPAPTPPIRDVPPAQDDGDYDPYRYPAPPPTFPSTHSKPGDKLVQASDPSLYDTPETQQKGVAPPMPPQHQMAADNRRSRDVGRTSLEVPRSSMATTRRSMEQSRPSFEQGQMAGDVDLAEGSLWWTQANTPPPSLQSRSDVLCEYEESTTSKRGGRTTISRDVYVLYSDYSQSTITARFDSREPNDVAFEQRHEPAPAKLRQDQLEDVYAKYGPAVANTANSHLNQSVGDGTAHSLVFTLLAAQPGALLPVGTRSFGALVYANIANATVQQFDEIRPGDVVSFRNAKFQGKHGAMHQKYSEDVGRPDHVAVVAEWDGTKKKVRALEQGRDGKAKVRQESFKLGDLRSGEVKVWRVMSRQWVGWDS